MGTLTGTRQKSNKYQPSFLARKTKIRSFFKIILPSTIRDRQIGIPRKFVKNLGNELSDVAVLKVPSGGGVWHVGLKKTDGEIWLQNGWHEFVEYYSIRAGHFLVFRYNGNSQFFVLIFDTSASEIDYPSNSDNTDEANHDDLGCLMPKQNEDEEEEEDLVEIVGVSRYCPTPPPVVEIIDDYEVETTTKGMGNPPSLPCSIRLSGQSNWIKRSCESETRSNKKRVPNHDRGCMVPKHIESDEEDSVEILGDYQCHTPASVVDGYEVQTTTSRMGYPSVLRRSSRLAAGQSNSVQRSHFASKTRFNNRPMTRSSASLKSCSSKFDSAARKEFERSEVRGSSSRKLALDTEPNQINQERSEPPNGGNKKNWHPTENSFRNAVESRNLSRKSKSGGFLFHQDVHAIKQGQHTPVPERCPKLKALVTRRISRQDKYRALQAAKAFKSENPFFTVIMQPSYVKFSLNIPFSFMKTYYGLKAHHEVTLGVSNGKTWLAQCSMYQRLTRNKGECKLGTGWGTFVRENNLEVGDVCVFELIRTEDVVLINVSIFRVRKDVPTLPIGDTEQNDIEI